MQFLASPRQVTFVKNGENGFIVKEDDLAALSSAMIELFHQTELRKKMGLASRRIIADWDYRLHVPAVLDAIRFATST